MSWVVLVVFQPLFSSTTLYSMAFVVLSSWIYALLIFNKATNNEDTVVVVAATTPSTSTTICWRRCWRSTKSIASLKKQLTPHQVPLAHCWNNSSEKSSNKTDGFQSSSLAFSIFFPSLYSSVVVDNSTLVEVGCYFEAATTVTATEQAKHYNRANYTTKFARPIRVI